MRCSHALLLLHTSSLRFAGAQFLLSLLRRKNIKEWNHSPILEPWPNCTSIHRWIFSVLLGNTAVVDISFISCGWNRGATVYVIEDSCIHNTEFIKQCRVWISCLVLFPVGAPESLLGWGGQVCGPTSWIHKDGIMVATRSPGHWAAMFTGSNNPWFSEVIVFWMGYKRGDTYLDVSLTFHLQDLRWCQSGRHHRSQPREDGGDWGWGHRPHHNRRAGTKGRIAVRSLHRLN